MREKTKRFLSLLLTAVLLVTAQGFTAFADTVSTNDAQALPSNPVHHCVYDDVTDWSYIYFGSYPQSEETDSSVIAAIDSAINEGKGTEGVDGVGTDVKLSDGTKYRRISKGDTNSDYYFDEKPTNNGYRYFKWERIKWRVLDNNDNGTLFVVADSALDCKCYNDESTRITWENSTIRSWLNGSFYNTAFSSSEQDAIADSNVVNEDNPEDGTKGGNDTTDKVYLLSIGEAANAAYGFCSNSDAHSPSRWLQPSNYAQARGTYTYSDSSTGNNASCVWWLRSPGYSGYSAADVDCLGYVFRGGSTVNISCDGAAPALHINLLSDFWSVTGDGNRGEREDMPANPVHHCVQEDVTDWSYIYFGSYPQSEETDSSVIAAIDSAIEAGNGTAGADKTGMDVWVNGTKYRRISKDDTTYEYFFDEKPTNNGYRYFKWERIKWRVLDNNDNETLFVMADSALDSKYYHDNGGSITWENSTIRSWLNGSFYNTVATHFS